MPTQAWWKGSIDWGLADNDYLSDPFDVGKEVGVKIDLPDHIYESLGIEGGQVGKIKDIDEEKDSFLVEFQSLPDTYEVLVPRDFLTTVEGLNESLDVSSIEVDRLDDLFKNSRKNG